MQLGTTLMNWKGHELGSVPYLLTQRFHQGKLLEQNYLNDFFASFHLLSPQLLGSISPVVFHIVMSNTVAGYLMPLSKIRVVKPCQKTNIWKLKITYTSV